MGHTPRNLTACTVQYLTLCFQTAGSELTRVSFVGNVQQDPTSARWREVFRGITTSGGRAHLVAPEVPSSPNDFL